jgi:hypothetical protein
LEVEPEVAGLDAEDPRLPLALAPLRVEVGLELGALVPKMLVGPRPPERVTKGRDQ